MGLMPTSRRGGAPRASIKSIPDPDSTDISESVLGGDMSWADIGFWVATISAAVGAATGVGTLVYTVRMHDVMRRAAKVQDERRLFRRSAFAMLGLMAVFWIGVGLDCYDRHFGLSRAEDAGLGWARMISPTVEKV